jgi:hypothetical protein
MIPEFKNLMCGYLKLAEQKTFILKYIYIIFFLTMISKIEQKDFTWVGRHGTVCQEAEE